MSNAVKKQALFAQQNAEAAAIIAADTERYPGLMQAWARAFLAVQETGCPSVARSAARAGCERGLSGNGRGV
jgi:hypothetical protein